ncbi:MAG: hypothetical protein JEZ09_00620 [Salinivirgaceae bacterium]|nr:hypothetical protein [Salinivirgaceae bacterium]
MKVNFKMEPAGRQGILQAICIYSAYNAVIPIAIGTDVDGLRKIINLFVIVAKHDNIDKRKHYKFDAFYYHLFRFCNVYSLVTLKAKQALRYPEELTAPAVRINSTFSIHLISK